MPENRKMDEREPAEGARDNVNVPHASDEAARDPNRPESQPDRTSLAGGTRPERADAEQAHTPPRDESRETGNDDEGGRHNPRRTSM